MTDGFKQRQELKLVQYLKQKDQLIHRSSLSCPRNMTPPHQNVQYSDQRSINVFLRH